MPVPVPKYSRPPAHLVIKPHRHSDPPHPSSLALVDSNAFNQIGSQRIIKPHRIWEEDCADNLDFCDGLTTAVNARVIKGVRAQACLPPISALARHSAAYANKYRHSTGDMTYEAHMSYSDGEDADSTQISPYGLYSKGFGVFSPLSEDPSPEPLVEDDPSSSPIGPLTPFGDFIDRAMGATLESSKNIEQEDSMFHRGQAYDPLQDHRYSPSYSHPQFHAPAKHPLKEPVANTISAPSASLDYKKLAEPLSEWLACYVWRVCTTGTGLHRAFCRPSSYPQRHSMTPPVYLAVSIRSLLLSTLLQPSAIFLSLWYLTQLPVFLGPVSFEADYLSETEFRAELLGDNEHTSETHAPFRVFLLGCMLANKWLDDHTFSNKTWHTISNVEVRSLNRLEFLALAILRHDISISPPQWSQWLSQLILYHTSLSSTACPQPISRPSMNPHAIIKKSLEELLQVTVASTSSQHSDVACANNVPEPIFLGLEERRKEKLVKDEAASEGNVDVLDIDLDEDGPLREEYLPKRRTSRSDSERAGEDYISKRAYSYQTADPKSLVGRILPPPAKWSPSGDEPILRDRNRISGPYVAPQPAPPAMPTNSFLDNGYLWAHDMPVGYVYDSAFAPTRLPYEYGYSYGPARNRPQSFYPAQENMQPRLHSRSHSQMPVGYGYESFARPDIKLGQQSYIPDQYGYYVYPFSEESTFTYPGFQSRS